MKFHQLSARVLGILLVARRNPSHGFPSSAAAVGPPPSRGLVSPDFLMQPAQTVLIF
jgi:hypothetical protein